MNGVKYHVLCTWGPSMQVTWSLLISWGQVPCTLYMGSLNAGHLVPAHIWGQVPCTLYMGSLNAGHLVPAHIMSKMLHNDK